MVRDGVEGWGGKLVQSESGQGGGEKCRRLCAGNVCLSSIGQLTHQWEEKKQLKAKNKKVPTCLPNLREGGRATKAKYKTWKLFLQAVLTIVGLPTVKFDQ